MNKADINVHEKQEEGNLVTCYNVDELKDILVSETKPAQKDKYCISYLYKVSKSSLTQKQKVGWWLLGAGRKRK